MNIRLVIGLILLLALIAAIVFGKVAIALILVIALAIVIFPGRKGKEPKDKGKIDEEIEEIDEEIYSATSE